MAVSKKDRLQLFGAICDVCEEPSPKSKPRKKRTTTTRRRRGKPGVSGNFLDLKKPTERMPEAGRKVMLRHGVAVQNQSPSADGIFTHDLPVGPLSVINLVLRPLNNNADIADSPRALDIAGAVNRVNVLHRGSAIFSASGRDALAMAVLRHGYTTMWSGESGTNNDRRALVLPIFLGRRPYDPESCFPASQRGELAVELDLDIADTGYDDLDYTIETIEIPGASPREYEKQTVQSLTFSATGDNDMDLPIGNVYRGLLLFATTVWTGATPAPSWGRVQLLLNNEQVGYVGADFEALQQVAGLMGHGFPLMDTELITAQDGTAADNLASHPLHTHASYLAGGWEAYAYLPLDVWGDDRLAINTAGASRFHLRADAETADAVRVLPVERIRI